MTDRSKPLIAVISAGAMGSAIAARLVAHGARVLTSLDGRGPASVARASAAGMLHATDAELVRAELILSIVPPGQAEHLARRLLPQLAAAESKPLYVDANALSPASKLSLATLVESTGCTMLDGSIIGAPPTPGSRGPVLYVAGPDAARCATLRELGLDVRVLDKPIGAAAALKMCYAGINKGATALGTAMLLAAERYDSADALLAELESSQPDLMRRFGREIPIMYSKAHRWVAEMREIADFLHDDPAAAMMYEGMARLFERLAADVAGDEHERRALDRVLRR